MHAYLYAALICESEQASKHFMLNESISERRCGIEFDNFLCVFV